MSFTPYASAVAGSILAASFWNAQVKNNGLVLKTSIMDDGRLNGEIKAFREDVSTLSISAGSLALDLALFNNFKVSLTSNVTTINVSNWVTAKATSVVLRLTQDGTGSRTVTFPAGWKWSGNVAPTMTATANKSDVIVLWSDDGGTTIFASVLGQNF
jgi:hypothetical protein